jgi:hypothetical protein
MMKCACLSEWFKPATVSPSRSCGVLFSLDTQEKIA